MINGGELPLINQMIEDDSNELLANLDELVKLHCHGWQQSAIDLFRGIINAEGSWVDPGRPCDSPGVLLDNYGIRDDERETEPGDSSCNTHGMGDVDAVIHVLKTHCSWGEFCGGVMGSMHKWSPMVQDRIWPALRHTMKYIIAHGCDH